MVASGTELSHWVRWLARPGVVVLGVVALVGSGGPVADSGAPDGCPREASAANVDPQRAVVSVGDSITFTARPDFSATAYRWRRCRQGSCIDVAGLSGDTFTWEGVRLDDDGSTVDVVADGCRWEAKAGARVEVLPAPGTTHADTEFLPSDWEATLWPEGAGGSTQAFTPSAAGGNPGAFATLNYRVEPPASELRVFHGSLKSTYDPRAQGAAYAVDFSVDCRRPLEEGGASIAPRKAFVQAGRWYQARSVPPGSGCGYAWGAGVERSSLSLDHFDFELVAGPPCGPGEVCPDASASGAPIRFGFIGGAQRFPAAAFGVAADDVDNWRVTVWRR
jgi:hypothetical protein